jgi:hypothetical protein
MKLSAFGISTDLPPGWEGRITKRTEPPSTALTPNARGAAGERTSPVVHLANFALPERRGDFGSGAVDLMGGTDVFVCLFEYGPESLGQPLFARRGMPRELAPRLFSTTSLQRTIAGQSGYQVFFTEAERPFCLYVVLGSHRASSRLVPGANTALRATRIVRR